ncbi:SOS response-associated peptidase [Kaarinaea lacus]
MCGRFSLTPKIEQVIEKLNIINSIDLEPSYNIAPSQNIAVVRNIDNQRIISTMRWGLIPFWMKELPKSNILINARSETVASKPSFRNAYKNRRCLIPADGFYEWQKAGNNKQPYYIQLKNKEIFTFAGLWEQWQSEGNIIESCTIITTEANNDMKPIHHRMPVIIDEKNYQHWFESTDPQDLLTPYPNGRLQTYAISSYVNNPRNNDASCIDALPR